MRRPAGHTATLSLVKGACDMAAQWKTRAAATTGRRFGLVGRFRLPTACVAVCSVMIAGVSGAVAPASAASPPSVGGKAAASGTGLASVGPEAGGYSALAPARILDTRGTLGGFNGHPVGAHAAISVAVAGQGGVPA